MSAELRRMSSILNAERSSFLGPSVPSYITEFPKLVPSFKKNHFRQLLTIAVQDLEGKTVAPDSYSLVRNSSGGDTNFDFVFGALYYLLKCCLPLRNSLEVLKEELQVLKIPNDYAEEIVNVVSKPRKQSIKNLQSAVPALAKLALMKWRVDVTISTSVLSRVLEPVIVIEFKLTNSLSVVFEAKTSQFHKFRFALANLMKEVENLESRSILKH